MCGISVIIGGDIEENLSIVSSMTERISHRGPDSRNVLQINNNVPVVMGHARLSIIDLSDQANQPFCSLTKDKFLVFNGEIYNFKELREELSSEGRTFSTNSDTEVLLTSYEHWGVECLKKFNGMFSFVIFDKNLNKILIARDRFGVKPLYIYQSNNGEVVICSEVKQLLACPKIQLKMNKKTIGEFMFYGTHKMNNQSFFEDIRELNPGSYGELFLDSSDNLQFAFKSWYHIPEIKIESKYSQARDKFKEIFDDALNLRLNADVSIGTGFSGGLDSSAIVCSIYQMIKEGNWNNPLRTFSGRFRNSLVDEGKYIEPVIKKCDTVHEDIFVDGRNLFQELQTMAYHHDEPILTSSVYAQWCVFRAVRESGVKVTIDGHGADEILGGYKGFYRPRLLELFKRFKFLSLYKESKAMVNNLKYPKYTPIVWIFSSLFGSTIRNAFKKFNFNSTFNKKRLNQEFQPIEDPLSASGIYNMDFMSFSKEMLSHTSLPAQLQWADRSSMAFGVESRSPFMDYRLVEFCINLPSDFKLNHGKNKKIMRDGIGSRLTSDVLSRKDKQGFESPESEWLLKDGLDETKEFLVKIRSVNSDIFSKDSFQYLEDIVTGEAPYDPFLWRAISLTAWRIAFNV